MSLEHKSLVTSIVEKIEEQILSGELEPGERIFEQRLCEDLDVSRSPVREALITLESQGFVVKEARKGVRVAEPTPKEITDAYTIRANLESLATYLTVQRSSPSLIEKLEALNDKLKQICTTGATNEYYRINLEFHDAIINECGNEQLIQMLHVFIKKTARYRKQILFFPGRIEESLKKHEQLIQSLKERNAERAEKIRKELILSSIKHLKLNTERKEDRVED